MTKNLTSNHLERPGQFLVKTWSAFYVGQKVGNMRADSEDFQAKQGVQKVDRNGTEKVHRRFTETSPDFRALSLEMLRQGCGKVAVRLR